MKFLHDMNLLMVPESLQTQALCYQSCFTALFDGYKSTVVRLFFVIVPEFEKVALMCVLVVALLLLALVSIVDA